MTDNNINTINRYNTGTYNKYKSSIYNEYKTGKYNEYNEEIDYKEKYKKYKRKYQLLRNEKNSLNMNYAINNCNFDKNMDCKIYHFTTENLTNTMNIKNPTTDRKIIYIKVVLFSIELINQIIEECNLVNILIVINSILLPDIYSIFNNYLTNNTKIKNSILQNITIINLTNDNTKVIYNLTNSQNENIFRKIINVFGKDSEKILVTNPNFFRETPVDRNLIKEINTDEKSLWQISFTPKNPMYGGEIRKLYIRLMNTKSKSSNLSDQWWFKWYFSVPPCLSYRLSQSSGTCWLNSIINSMFFVPKISEILVKNFETSGVTPIDLKNFKFQNLNVMLNSLIYDILIKKTKAKTEDGDFIGSIASQIKCIYEKTDYCNKIGYGDAGDSYQGIKVILENLFGINSDIYACIFLYSELNKEYNKKIDEYNTLIRLYTEEVNDYNSKVQSFNKSSEQQSLISELSSLSEKIHKDENSINEYNIDNLTIKYENESKELVEKKGSLNKLSFSDKLVNKLLTNIVRQKKYPQILVIKTNILEKTIKIDSYTYTLSSSTIAFGNIKHIVSGIICDNKSYIYDSNNIIVQDSWDKGDFSNYVSNENTINLYKTTPIFDLFGYTIYVRN